MIEPEQELGDEIREASHGAWRDWKSSLAAFVRALASLGELRWEMAKGEAKEWGRAALLRVMLFAGAAIFSILALILLAVGLVLVLQILFGSLLAAIFACFGICVVAAAALGFAATRGRFSHTLFQRTAGEIRKDFESWTGEKPGEGE